MQDINNRLKANLGMAVIIDYGEDTSDKDHCHGDTLQALYRHQYASPFEKIGQQDLSHAVDFGVLKRLIDPLLKSFLTSQSEFLLSLGLEQRLESLCQKASPEQAFQLRTAAVRLIAPSEMGDLFKVLTIESV
jgi:NADH dehydrogenase [ubiquinone] 1 alpha subcomplex assembly factor 7